MDPKFRLNGRSQEEKKERKNATTWHIEKALNEDELSKEVAVVWLEPLAKDNWNDSKQINYNLWLLDKIHLIDSSRENWKKKSF